MGRAIVREPAAFLMDEPLSNLDAKLRVEMRAYLATLHQRLKTTTLYVTHDQTEAMTMGDRVAVMHDGQLQQVDVPQALYEHPVNAFVAGFIGSPSMNLVHSQLTERDGALYADLRAGEPASPDSVLATRPALRGYAGKAVIAGIRPEDIEDAALVASPNGATLDVEISLAEPMGAEVIAHFPIAAQPLVGPTAQALARGEDEDARGCSGAHAARNRCERRRADHRAHEPALRRAHRGAAAHRSRRGAHALLRPGHGESPRLETPRRLAAF